MLKIFFLLISRRIISTDILLRNLHFFFSWGIAQQYHKKLVYIGVTVVVKVFQECGKFSGSGGSCAIVVFRGSKIFTRGYFVGPNFFLVVILWVQLFFSSIFCWFKIFSRGYFVDPKFFLVGIL